MKQLIVVFALFIFQLQVFAGIKSFDKRFTLVKDDRGNVTFVKMNFANNRFSIMPYVKIVIEDLKSEIKRLQNKSSYEVHAFLDGLEAEVDMKNDEVAENIFVVRKTFDHLRGMDNIDHFFKPILKSNLFENFKKEIQNALDKYSLAVIASTEDSRYFYKRNVTYEILKRALDFARKTFDSVPVLNIASFLLVKVHNLVLEQRTFYQNMLLFYLDNFSAKELGMTDKEVDTIFSSIYESRISYLNIWESNRAVEN